MKLRDIASYVGTRAESSLPARLTFICTHNSRRSHLAHVWAQTAAHYFGVKAIETYSGGTEATAFNPRAVAALQRAGFMIEKKSESDNPLYSVAYSSDAPPIEAFSKVYSADPNPHSDYCAVMTCGEADRDCPVVLGAEDRVSLPYTDPKEADGSENETSVYDERCRQISIEMLYLFSIVSTPDSH